MIKDKAYMKIDILGNIYIKDIIIYYDKPLVFSCINDFGQNFIASCITIDEIEEWLFAPMTSARLIQGLSGNIQAYKLFTEVEGEFLWKVSIDSSKYLNGTAKTVSPNSLLEDDLPDKDIVYDIYSKEQIRTESDIVNNSILERREIIDISLEPKNSHMHEIDTEVLAKVLELTQTIINLISHKDGISSRVPRHIKEENKLNVTDTYAASFGIRMKSNNLADILNESKIQKSLDIFMDILESKENSEKLIEIFKNLNPAVSSIYKNLLKVLQKDEIGIKTYCAFPNSKYRKCEFNTKDIENSLENLEKNVKEIEKEIDIVGEIVAIDVSRNKFKFNEGDTIIQGDIYENVNVEEYVLPKRAKARIKIVTKLNEITSKEHITYILLNLDYDLKNI